MLYHSRVMRIVLSVVLVVLGLVAFVGPAAAQEGSDEEARMHFRLGRAYYDSGRFEEAANEFQQAYELSQRPQLLYNVFIAHRDAGELGEAIEALETYLELVPDAVGRESLEARLQSMRRLHRQQQAAREAQGREGTQGSAQEGTGTGEGTDTGEGTGTETGAGTETGTGGDELGEGDGTGAPPPEIGDDGGGTNLVPWVVMGVGGAIMAGAIVTGVLALGAESQLEEECPDDACTSSDWMDTRDTGKTMATLTDVLLITGGLTVAAGAALLFLLDDGGSVERDPTLSAACTTDGCGASATVPF